MRMTLALSEMSSSMVAVMIMSDAHRFQLVRQENDVIRWSRQSRSSLASLSAILHFLRVEELDGPLSKDAV